MKFLSYITSNHYLNVAVVAWFVAQLIKVVLTLFTTKKINLERMLGSGGMPSSHSSFTVSMATALAIDHGFDSPEFAIAFAFAAVVMHDAMGVRRAAGEQAKALNMMIFEFDLFSWFKNNEEPKNVDVPLDKLEKFEKHEADDMDSEMDFPLFSKKLKELLGHTPLEVLGGCLLGVLIAFVMR